MTRRLRKISAGGDTLVAEWETSEVTADRLKEIEAEFTGLMKAGYFAADITDKKDVLIKEFNPDADILMIPRVQGG